MKKKTLALVTLCAVLLTGCGTNFDITPAIYRLMRRE